MALYYGGKPVAGLLRVSFNVREVDRQLPTNAATKILQNRRCSVVAWLRVRGFSLPARQCNANERRYGASCLVGPLLREPV